MKKTEEFILGIVGQLLLQFILIMLNAFFACAEIAVISINDAKLALLAAQGDKRAVRLQKLTSQPAKFLATIQVAITLAGFLGSAFAADNFASRLTNWAAPKMEMIPAAVIEKVAIVIVTLILSYFTLVLGELVPKRLAMKKAETLGLSMSAVICAVSKLSAPLVWLLTASTNGVLRLFGIDPNAKDEDVSEEEIKMMVDAGSEQGVIDTQEQEIIHNLFEFDDLTAGDFATHRTEMVTLWMEDDLSVWEETVRGYRHSLYPICEGNVDNVVGVLNIKDYYRMPADERTKENVQQYAIRPPFFVPESVKADVLFRKMKTSRCHFAVVIDEYGGTSGIVTMNDLLEQLVGDLEDDTTAVVQDRPEILLLSENVWEILGTASLDDVIKALQVELPVEEYDTFGGYVFGLYGSIPDDGSELELDTDALHISVKGIENHRVVNAVVEKKEQVSDDREETDSDD